MTADSLFSLKGKTALVTGASYGLGVTFAETLAGAGANLVIAARSLDRLQALAGRLTADGHDVLAVKCDVGNPEDVAATVAEGWKRFGRIDILVNNAGVVAEVDGRSRKNSARALRADDARQLVLGTRDLLSRSGGAATSRRQGRGQSSTSRRSRGWPGWPIFRPPTRRRRRRSSTSRATWRAAGRDAGFA